MSRLTIFILALSLTFYAKGQVNNHIIRQMVLEKGIVDSLFIFGKWTKDGQTETHIKYLGQVMGNLKNRQ